MKQRVLWSLALVALVILSIFACESTNESSDGDTPDRPVCEQATDCGSEGRSFWVCSPEGYCYTIYEYCYLDSECKVACVDHVCEGGKKDEVVVPDGDVDTDLDAVEEEKEQIPCEYECCTNADCPEGGFCDKDRHTCQILIPCEGKECCQDYDCWVNESYGDEFICKFNKCIDPNAPCPFECCETEDCTAAHGAGWICILTEGEEQGTCRNDNFSCNPGDKACCFNDPGNPDCIELGPLSSEAILTCNSSGDAYELSMCPEYNDCFPTNVEGEITCERNGRCGTTDDCQCPNQCVDTPNGKRCMIPTVAENEVCAEKRCGGENPDIIGYCPEGLQCCVDGESGVGTCTTCK